MHKGNKEEKTLPQKCKGKTDFEQELTEETEIVVAPVTSPLKSPFVLNLCVFAVKFCLPPFPRLAPVRRPVLVSFVTFRVKASRYLRERSQRLGNNFEFS
jgi:hypothetical protein